MRRAFTLMELMVVVGIMAFLGLAATNGYNALQRGIADRGAVDAASTLFRAAKERAMVDRVPTMVFCYNRKIHDNERDDENAVIVGEAVAIRRAGRVTYVIGDEIFDEFGDLDRSYDVVNGDQGGGKGMRLWYCSDDPKSDSGMKYAIVADTVREDQPGDAPSFMPWADGENAKSNHIIKACAFVDKKGGNYNFKVGDGYGLEFQTLRLPTGYMFERSAFPQSLGDISQPKCFYFDPADIQDSNPIEICAWNPSGTGDPVYHHSAGNASSREDSVK